jgi:RND family efflux transporter MFP subunit
MKTLATLLILALLTGGGVWLWRDRSSTAAAAALAAVPTARAERRAITQTLACGGEVQPIRQVDVKPEVSAKLVQLLVNVGDRVTEGQVVARLNDKDLLTEKSAAESEVEGARLSFEKADRDLKRKRQMRVSRVISQEEVDNAQSEFDLARNAQRSAQSRLDTVLERITKTVIRAPLTGTVLTVPVAEGQIVVGAASVNSGTTLMTLADLSQMMIVANINQVDVARLSAGKKVVFSADPLPGVMMSGVIERVAPVAAVKNNVKSFEVRVRIEALDPRLRPGMTANLTFDLGGVSDALAVPVTAVFSDGDTRNVVYVQGTPGNQEPEKRVVEIGLSNFDFAEVKSGLSDGDVVLLNKPAAQRSGS